MPMRKKSAAGCEGHGHDEGVEGVWRQRSEAA